MFSWKRIIKIVVGVIVVVAILAGIYFGVTSRRAKIILASVISDNHEHYLDCYELPFYPQAQKAILAHQDAVEKLKKLGAFEVSVEEIKCKGWDGGMEFVKGDIKIQYNTHSQRVAIEKFLGKTFFGIPYKGENH